MNGKRRPITRKALAVLVGLLVVGLVPTARAAETPAAETPAPEAPAGAGPVSFAGAASAPAADVEAARAAVPEIDEATGTVFYVDCAAAAPGNGTIDAPFSTLAEASAIPLQPGDQVRFRRGSTCAGTYAPSGNGAEDNPIVIGAYGKGPLPVIRGLATGTAAVTVVDMSHVVVQDLELTNPEGDRTITRQGILVSARTRVVRDVTVQRLNVHDVVGSTANQANGGGGIIVTAAPSGAGVSARFDRVIIQDNTVTDAQNNGITVAGGGTSRPAADQPWPSASTNVVVTRNVVTRVAGNGIIILRSQSPVSSWNTVRVAGMANRDFLDPVNRHCSAGLWFFETNNALAEHNEVSHMVFKGEDAAVSGCDGEAYDIDYAQDGTVFQYNYSHDNEGGFMLFCATRAPHRGEVRFNLSIDDGSIFGATPCEYGSDPISYNLTGIRVYNNTWIAKRIRVWTQHDEVTTIAGFQYFGDFEFRNNILYSTEPVPADNLFHCGEAANCTNNLFFNMPTYGTEAVQGDPLFVDPSVRGTGLGLANAFRIRPGSPAICAGRPIAPVAVPTSVATHDFFGNPIPDPPSIGLHQRGCDG